MMEVLRTTFGCLTLRNYRLLWAADLAVTWADFMEMLILSWYVLSHTNSPLLLGFYAALRFSGSLGAPFFGLVVDRFNRGMLYAVSRTVLLVIAASFLLLSTSDALSPFLVLILSTISGFSKTFDQVVRNSLLPEVVGHDRLQSGLALSRTGRDITQIAGPITGGLLMSTFGLSQCFIVIFCLYISSLVLVMRIRLLSNVSVLKQGRLWADLWDGIRYIQGRPVLLSLLLLAFIVNIFAYPFSNSLLIVFAKDVLATDSSGLGALMGFYAAGAILGSLIVATLSGQMYPGRVMFCAAAVWHMGIMVMSAVHGFYLSIPVIFVIGTAQSVTVVILLMLIIDLVPYDVRGRIIGLRQLAVYGLPIGLIITGFTAGEIGILSALILTCIMGLISLVVILICWPEILKSKQSLVSDNL